MMYAVSRMAAEQGQAVPRAKSSFLLRWSAFITVALLLAIYAMLRFRMVGGGE